MARVAAMNSQDRPRARDRESLLGAREHQSGRAAASSRSPGEGPRARRYRIAVPADDAVEAYVDTTEEGLFRAVVVEPSGHVWVGPRRASALKAISDVRDRVRKLDSHAASRRSGVVSARWPYHAAAEDRALGH